MNARDQIKPKSIRLAILMALSDGAIATIDDLQMKIDEPRKKVANNVFQTVVDGLAKRLRDDVTGGPAYQITGKGKDYLAKFADGKAEEPPVYVVEAALPETPVCTESQTTDITPGVKMDSITQHCPSCEQHVREFDLEHDDKMQVAYSLEIAEAKVSELEQQALHHMKMSSEWSALSEQQAMINLDLARELSGHKAITQSACKDANDLRDKVTELESELAEYRKNAQAGFDRQLADQKRIKELNAELGQARTDMESLREASKICAVGFVLQRPAKPLVRFSKQSNAEARAMAFARTGQRAQVFALVPVGVAVPGAVWKEAK